MRVFLCVAVVTRASGAVADDYSACSGLGVALTEHSCFHTQQGPFVAVTAASEASATPPDVDPVHTHFTVSLPARVGVGVVTYQPARTGDWVVFVSPSSGDLQVLDGAASALPELYRYAEPTCAELGLGRVYAMVAGVRYRLVLESTTSAAVGVVIEHLADFRTRVGRDRDGDSYGDARDVRETSCLPPAGYVANDGDCDDADPTVHPAVAELCDGRDQDCDRVVDDGWPIGEVCRVGTGSCERAGTWTCGGSGVVCTATVPSRGVPETCNGRDDDCDGVEDEGGASLCVSLEAPACVGIGGVTRCGCRVDADCGSVTSARICDTQRGLCVDGCVESPGRNGCPNDLLCTSADPELPGSCTSTCTQDRQCLERDPVRPVCLGRGLRAGCVECVSDTQCVGRADGRLRCVGPGSTCAECSPRDRSACDARGSGDACLADGRCGCVGDYDCSKDQLCDPQTQQCTQCGAWLGETHDTDADATVAPNSCTTATPPDTALGIILVLLQLVRRRRPGPMRSCAPSIQGRMHRVPGRVAQILVLVVLFVGCEADGVSAAACPCAAGELCVDGACRAACESYRDCPPSETCHPDYGFCLDVGQERCRCSPRLSVALRQHACQHGDLGPFEDVVAAADPRAAAPPVDRTQRTFRVALDLTRPSRVSYRPVRDGDHAVFYGLGQQLELADSTGRPLTPLHVESAGCAAFDRISLYRLARDEVVTVTATPTGRAELTLFLEHKDTFPEAWDVTCEQ